MIAQVVSLVMTLMKLKQRLAVKAERMPLGLDVVG